MNDEDIKILEKLLNKKYDDELLNTLEMISKEDEVYILTIFEKQAIKNLLNRNKELEKTITRKMNNNKKLACKYLQERHKNRQLELNEKEQEIIEAYRNMKNITGSDEWIVCNPSTMWSEYFIPVSKIKEKIEISKKQYEFFNNSKRTTKNIAKAYEIIIEFLQELLEGK